MKDNGTCPKCQSREIAGPHTMHADESHLKIDLPGISTATLEAYTCLKCGYTELYPDYIGFQNIIKNGTRYR